MPDDSSFRPAKPDNADSATVRAAQSSIDRAELALQASQRTQSNPNDDRISSRSISLLRSALVHLSPKSSTANSPDNSRSSPGALSPSVTSIAFGRFQIRQLLGDGGFGVVFLAIDLRLGRQVAIKIPRRRRATPKRQRKRVFREASLAAQLDHPGIVSVYDSGRIGTEWYIVSAFCPGPTLHEWTRSQQSVSPRIAVGIVAQIADAVQHAHSRGVLHRDLKPSNVLLKVDENNATPMPQLTDFGLARRLTVASTKNQSRKRIVGTLAFMAPEQTEDGPTKATIASDIYSLGALLFDVLAKRPPHQDDNTLTLLDAIRFRTPPNLRQLRADIPRDLEAICQKCLHKDPHHRYVTAADLSLDLRRFLDGQCVTARPVSSTIRCFRWCRRKPILASMLGLLLAVIIFAFIAVTSAWQSERTARMQAESSRLRAKKSVNDTYMALATKVLADEPHKEQLRYEFLQRALTFYEEIAAERSFDAESSFDLQVALHEIASLSGQLGHRDEAIHYRKRCLRIIEGLLHSVPEKKDYQFAHFHNLLLLSGELTFVGSNAEADAACRQAHQVILRLSEQHPQDLNIQVARLSCQLTYAQKLIDAGNGKVGISLLEETARRGVELSDHALETSDCEYIAVSAHQWLGVVAEANSDWTLADTKYHEAVKLAWSLTERFPTKADYRYQLCGALTSRAQVQWKMQNTSEAVRLFQEADGHLARLATDFPNIANYPTTRARTEYSLGELNWRDGRFDKAKDHFSKAIQQLEEIIGRFPQDVGATRYLVTVYESCPDEELRAPTRLEELRSLLKSQPQR